MMGYKLIQLDGGKAHLITKYQLNSNPPLLQHVQVNGKYSFKYNIVLLNPLLAMNSV
jgi:hypothetical protein